MASYYLFKKASGSLDIRHLNMCSYIFYILLAFTFIGSVQLLYGVSANEGVVPQDSTIRLYGWMGVMYTMIMVPIGMLIASFVLNVKSMKVLLIKYQSASLETYFSYNKRSFKYALYFFSCLSILAVIYAIASSPHVPLLNLLYGSSDYTLMHQQRNVTRLGVTGHRWLTVYLMMQMSFTQIFAYAAYSYWKMEREYKDLTWFWCMTFLSAIFLMWDMSKGRVLFFLMGLVIILINTDRRKIKKKVLLFWLLIWFFLTGLLQIYFHGVSFGESHGVLTILKVGWAAFKSRILVTQISGFYHCLDIFPSAFPFLGFSTTGRLIHEVLGLNYLPDYGTIVRYFTNPLAAFEGGYGHYTTFFMGEAWSNFGLIGILIAPLWVGFFIQTFNIFFLKSKKTPLHIAFYAMFTITFPILTSFRGFYYPVWVLQYAFMIFILLFVASMLKSVPKRGFGVKKRISMGIQKC